MAKTPTVTAPAVQPVPLPRPPVGFSHFNWAACVHEAGHVIGALARGLKVHRASVAQSCYVRRDPSSDRHTEGVAVLCGPVAELLLCDGDDPFTTGAASGDMANLTALSLSAAAVASARAEAERLVTVNRTAIGAVANHLARWAVIDGGEAAILFETNK